MSQKVFTRFKWFWAWQDDVEEKWLESMSRQGYHLISVGFPGVYSFVEGEPGDYAYRLDYCRLRSNDKQEYLQLFRDTGWEYLGELSAWQYFRKEIKPDEVNEIFTDVQSKIDKYKRVLAVLGLAYFLLLFVFTGRMNFTSFWTGSVQIFILAVLLLFTYAIVRLYLRIRYLQKSR